MKKKSNPWAPAKIKALRQRLGDTQEQFAQRLGIAFTTVNKWENNKSKPSKLGQRALDESSCLQGKAPGRGYSKLKEST